MVSTGPVRLVVHSEVAHRAVRTQYSKALKGCSGPTHDCTGGALLNSYLSKASRSQKAKRLELLHAAYGHPGSRVLQQILRQSAGPDRDLARYIHLLPPCNSCLFGKNKKKPHARTGKGPTDPAPYSSLFVDLSGRQQIPTADGKRYAMVIVDAATNMGWSILLKTTTAAESTTAFANWLKSEAQHAPDAPTVQTVRTDGGPEFSSDFLAMLADQRIKHSPVAAKSSAQNGRVERRIGIIAEKATVAMHWANAPAAWWGEAWMWATTMINLMPTQSTPGQCSPYELMNARAPDLGMAQPFGCLAFLHVPKEQRKGCLLYTSPSPRDS